MKLTKKLIPFLFLPLLFLTSCGSGDAAKIADSYHDLLKANNYDKIADTKLSSDATSITTKSDWVGLFKWVGEELGDIKSIEKLSGFNSSMNNGVTTVTLRYQINYVDKSIMYERIILIRDGGEFEIAGIAWNSNLDELPMPKSN